MYLKKLREKRKLWWLLFWSIWAQLDEADLTVKWNQVERETRPSLSIYYHVRDYYDDNDDNNEKEGRFINLQTRA